MTKLSTNQSPTSIATAETSAFISSSYSTDSLGADNDQHKFSNCANHQTSVLFVLFSFAIYLFHETYNVILFFCLPNYSISEISKHAK